MPEKRVSRIVECSPEDYHADRIGREITLNVSTAKALLGSSPLHAHSQHPRLGGHRSKSTRAANTGTILHSMILDKGKGLVEIHADDYRTEKAREDRDAAIDSHLIPVLTSEFRCLKRLVKIFSGRLAESGGIVLGGKSEVTVKWYEEHPRHTTACRGRLDHVVNNADGTVDIFDLKTTSVPSSPMEWSRTAFDRFYHVQAAAYTRAIEHAFPDKAGRVRFTFIVLELTPPYAVGVYRLSESFHCLGQLHWSSAVATWADCLTTGIWPGYSTGVTVVDAPGYALQREM